MIIAFFPTHRRHTVYNIFDLQMRSWYRGNYFDDDLRVRCSQSSHFDKLMDLFPNGDYFVQRNDATTKSIEVKQARKSARAIRRGTTLGDDYEKEGRYLFCRQLPTVPSFCGRARGKLHPSERHTRSRTVILEEALEDPFDTKAVTESDMQKGSHKSASHLWGKVFSAIKHGSIEKDMKKTMANKEQSKAIVEDTKDLIMQAIKLCNEECVKYAEQKQTLASFMYLKKLLDQIDQNIKKV